MPRNGSGTYVPPVGSFSPAVNGQQAQAADFNALLADLGGAMSQSIANDGQTTITADLPMAGFKLTDIDDASARNEYAAFGQVMDGEATYGTVGGTANAITLAFNPTFPAYVEGMEISFKASAANTGAVTVTVDALTAKDVKKDVSAGLQPGDIPSGAMVVLRYDGTNFQLASVAAPAYGTTVAKTTTYSVTIADFLSTILCDGTGGAFTVTLPAVGNVPNGFRVTIYKTDATLNAITVDGDGSETINGQTTYVLPFQGNYIEVISNGTAWFVISTGDRILGEYVDVSGSSTYAPFGCILPYGQAISRTDYAAYYALVGTTYGVGDGSTTFNVPDLRGRVRVGRDDMGGSAGNIIQRSTNITTSSGSPSATVASAAGLCVGMFITTTNVAAGTTITAISGTTITMSGNASASAGPTAARFSMLQDAQVLGGKGGSQTHTLITNELAAHTHGMTTTTFSAQAGAANVTPTSYPGSGTVTQSTGGDAPHNNVQPGIISNVFLRVFI